MSKESLAHIDDRLVFRDTMQSEQNTRRLGGVPTDVNYENGIGTNNSGYIDYNSLILPSTWSIRVKFNISDISVTNEIFGNLFVAGHYTRLQIQTTGQIRIYNEANIGTLTTNTLSENIDYELVLSFDGTNVSYYINGSSFETPDVISGVYVFRQLLAAGDNTLNFHGDVELFEIRKGTLTPSEVKNLWENKTYHELPDKIDENTYKILDVAAHGGVLENKMSGDEVGNELHVDSNAVSIQNEVNTTTGWSTQSSNVLTSQSDQTNNSEYAFLTEGNTAPFNGSAVLKSFTTIVGKKYRLAFDWRHVGIGGSWSLYSDTQYRIIINNLDITWRSEIYEFIAIATTTIMYFRESGSTNDGGAYIDNVSLKEMVPDVIPTDIEIKKVGANSYSPLFDGVGSKIDCGNYDDLTGDKTFLAIVNANNFGHTSGRILDNSKLVIWAALSTNSIAVQSDGSTSVTSATDSISINKYCMVAITRTDNGTVNIYIEGILSGTADRDSGTPEAGITNILIGDRNTGAREFGGFLPQVEIYNGIMSLQQIAQWVSNNRRLYV